MGGRRLLLCWAVCAALGLAACSDSGPALGDNDVLGAISAGANAPKCTLVKVGPKRKLEPDEQKRPRAKMAFSADCRAAAAPANAAPLRVSGEASFTHHHNRNLFASMNAWLADDVTWDTAASAADPIAPSGEFSDAPQCNALIARWHREVLPCLQGADPAGAARLAERIAQSKVELRIGTQHRGNEGRNRRLIDMDERCIEFWRQVHRQMDAPPAVAACRLPN
jgi:hypothetical protein